MANELKTRLNRNWLLKIGIFLVVFLVFGTWGLADALHFYPRRGALDASFKLRAYLEAAQAAGRLSSEAVKIPDPAAERSDLISRRAQLEKDAQGSTLGARQAKMDHARLELLESLSRMWRLRPDPFAVHETSKPIGAGSSVPAGPKQTIYWDTAAGAGFTTTGGPDTRTPLTPNAVLAELTQKWNTTKQPTPLSGFDMFFQWLFVVVGYGGGLWMLVVIFRARAKAFKWDPDAQRLTLPDSTAIVPSDIKEFDKRKWHKFFVTLVLNDGREVKLDLLRYSPLEDWILAMEKTAFPESAKPAEPAAADVPADESAGNAEAATPNN